MIRSPTAYKSLSSQDRNHRIVPDSEIDKKLEKMWANCQKQLQEEPDKGYSLNTFFSASLSGLNPTSEKAEPQKKWMDWILSEIDFESDADSLDSKSPNTDFEHPVGIYHARGRRPEMEDEHIVESFILNINGKSYEAKIFGIFDGHGGNRSSKYVKDHITPKLKIALENLSELTDAGIWNALKLTFVIIHEDLQRESLITTLTKEGTTALISLILDDNLWTANVGDSRSIFIDDETNLYQLSEDAKASDPKYKNGIIKRGGFLRNNRINGILAPGRALGDYAVGRGINPRPKITKVALSTILQNKGILMIGCDGVFEGLSSRQVKAIITKYQNKTAQFIAKKIAEEAFLAGSSDNLSTIVVHLFSKEHTTPKIQIIPQEERFSVDTTSPRSIRSILSPKKPLEYSIPENCCEWILNSLYKQDDKKTK